MPSLGCSEHLIQALCSSSLAENYFLCFDTESDDVALVGLELAL